MARSSTTSTLGSCKSPAGGINNLEVRLPPPRIIFSQAITRVSTHSGKPSGSPNGVTPPSSMPVSSLVTSGLAKDSRLTPSFFLTTYSHRDDNWPAQRNRQTLLRLLLIPEAGNWLIAPPGSRSARRTKRYRQAPDRRPGQCGVLKKIAEHPEHRDGVFQHSWRHKDRWLN